MKEAGGMKGDAVGRVRTQVESLARIEDGWLDDGTGRAVTPEELDAARWIGEALVLKGQVPFLYPSMDGGVRIEVDAPHPERGGWFFEVRAHRVKP